MRIEGSSDSLERYDEDLVHEIMTAIRAVRYGQVEIIIQDAKVIQINRTDKVRLNHPVQRI